MNLLESFKSHIGNKTFKSLVDIESALNDFQKVRVILLAVILMYRLVEHSTQSQRCQKQQHCIGLPERVLSLHGHPASVWSSRLGVRSPTALFQGKEVPKKNCKPLRVPWRPRRTHRRFIQATMLLIWCALSRPLHRNKRGSFYMQNRYQFICIVSSIKW